MDNKIPANAFGQEMALELPSFGAIPSIRMDFSLIRSAESRLIEAKTVNPSTYAELEHTFNDAYRILKQHAATVGYQILRSETELKKAEGTAILEKYPVFMEGKPKSMDNADTRKSFLALDTQVSALRDRLDSLRAMEMFIDGRIKVMENVCRYMKKSIDLVIRSGSNNFYVTNGRE